MIYKSDGRGLVYWQHFLDNEIMFELTSNPLSVVAHIYMLSARPSAQFKFFVGMIYGAMMVTYLSRSLDLVCDLAYGM